MEWHFIKRKGSKCDFSSVAQSCLTRCDLMDCSTPGFPVLHHLLALAHTHVHWVRETIQPSCPLSSPSSPASSLFSASGSFLMIWLFVSCGQSIQASILASILPMNILHWFPLELTGLISHSPRNSQDPSPAPQFKSINSSVLSLLYDPTLTSIHDYWKNHCCD